MPNFTHINCLIEALSTSLSCMCASGNHFLECHKVQKLDPLNCTKPKVSWAWQVTINVIYCVDDLCTSLTSLM